MWEGHLGSIFTAKHLVDLESPNMGPIYSVPYSAAPKARDLEKLEIDSILATNVIKLAQTEWVSPVVFAKKKEETLRFCVDHGEHNAVSNHDLYPLPRMAGCIDLLGNAQVFATLDKKSGYW